MRSDPKLMRSRRKLATVITVASAVSVVALVVVFRSAPQGRHASGPPCRVGVGSRWYALDFEQAASATTAAAVGKQRGMPDHAVTVALAVALQESGLHNLSYGDRDSLGLFQQRPSQGWGTPNAILTPRLAAAAFYDGLARVDGWQALSVTSAAQDVQRSADANAYAAWEPEARVLAQALTGEVPAGVACRFDGPAGSVPDTSLQKAISDELGPFTPGVAVAPARGWTIATWLVGHSHEHGVTSVDFNGQQWTASTGAWQRAPNMPGVRFA